MPFRIVRNDITKMNVDAIVNTANPQVAVGRGVDSAIYSAVGWEQLFKERQKIGPMRRGSAAITPGFNLKAKYIIHTVGPRWDEENPEPAMKQLRDCYDNSMSLAMEYGVSSIAFPLISTGSYSFPKEVGLRIAYDTISRYLYVSEMEVYLVVYDEEAIALSKKLTDDIDMFIGSRMAYQSAEAYRQDAPSAGNSYGSAVPRAMKVPAPTAAKNKRTVFGSIFFGKKSEAAPEADEAEAYEAALETPDYSYDESFTKYKNLDDLIKNAGETFQERLFRYIDMSGMSDVEVYKGANLSKQTFSKIKQPGHIPKKKTILALALSMKLSVDDTRDLLESAGQAFSPSEKVDLTVQYCMYHDIYSIFDVEHILFEKFGETLVS